MLAQFWLGFFCLTKVLPNVKNMSLTHRGKPEEPFEKAGLVNTEACSLGLCFCRHGARHWHCTFQNDMRSLLAWVRCKWNVCSLAGWCSVLLCQEWLGAPPGRWMVLGHVGHTCKPKYVWGPADQCYCGTAASVALKIGCKVGGTISVFGKCVMKMNSLFPDEWYSIFCFLFAIMPMVHWKCILLKSRMVLKCSSSWRLFLGSWLGFTETMCKRSN